jgi:hypothetical protein
MKALQPVNPWNEYGVSAFPPGAPMVGQEAVHRHLSGALANFQPRPGASAWFGLLTSTWGGGKTRTAHELVAQSVGQSAGWIDRTGTRLAPVLKPDFADGVLPVMISYKRVIRQVEAVEGRRLGFMDWIPRVSLAALLALKDDAAPELKAVRDHLQTFKSAVARALRELQALGDSARERNGVTGFLQVMQANGLNRLLVIVEEVEDPTEIRNKPGGLRGEEAYQPIKDTYLDVIPEVLKSDSVRQEFPNLGFLLLCSPAVHAAVEKISSQARRHYPLPIGRNTVADLCGYLAYLRREKPQIPEYSEALIRAAYVAVDRNMGWFNVLMYSVHRLWVEGEHDPVTLLRHFADGDPRGKEVFVENALERIPGAKRDGDAQRLLFGQTPVPRDGVREAARPRLLGLRVTDRDRSAAFVELHPLRAELSELLQTAEADAGVQVISGGGARVRAGDVEIDLARVVEDLHAYAHDGADRPLLPRDRNQFVGHLTSLHGISQTGAAGEYLYPVFVAHLAEEPTHLGPSFAALRQLDKRLQREEMQFRLLDDEAEDRALLEKFARAGPRDCLRRFQAGLLGLLEETQAPQEDVGTDELVSAAVRLERTPNLMLAQDEKIWLLTGGRGPAVRDALQRLATPTQPVRPILVLMAAGEPSQRELVEAYLRSYPATRERVFFFPLAELDERLLFLKSERPSNEALTPLARCLIYNLSERVKKALLDRFNELAGEGVVVHPLFRSDDWRTRGEDLAELWLYLAADPARTLTDARDHLGEALVANAQQALDPNRRTDKKRTTPLVDHDREPPTPLWAPALARLVRLVAGGAPSVDWLAQRFFGAGASPRVIVEQMLAWLEKPGLVLPAQAPGGAPGERFRLLTRGDVENAAEAAQTWLSGDLARLLTDLDRFTWIQQQLRAGGDTLKAALRHLTEPARLDAFQALGDTLAKAAADPAAIVTSGFPADVREAWAALALWLDFRRRQMNPAKQALGEALAHDAGALEQHVEAEDLPFRDLADGLGAFVKRLQTRVDELHAKVAAAQTAVKAQLEAEKLPVAVLAAAAEAIVLQTKLDRQLERSTKGVMAAETVIHALVTGELARAEERVAGAETRLRDLEAGCKEWIEEWRAFREAVEAQARRLQQFGAQVEGLKVRPTDPVYVRTHLEELAARLGPVVGEAEEMRDALQQNLEGDYAEQVLQKDQGGSPFGPDGQAKLLQEARGLIRQLNENSEVTVTRLRDKLNELSDARRTYSAQLLEERGTPTDPGLGLLRFALGRLDEGASVRAQRRLENTTTLREVVEEAARLRDEWRRAGPEKLGDPELFQFLLKVIADADLGTQSVPKGTDWVRLGQLFERGLISVNLSH